MPSFSRHDIESMSFRAAEQFREGTPLHESIVKIAKDNQMNPEQIKRLVEASNTTTFLNEFKSKDGNQRMVEFDVANPDKVIDEALASGSSASDKAPSISITISVDPNAGLHDTIDDENMPMPELEPSTEKAASYSEGFFLQSTEKTASLNSHTKYQIKESLLTKIADCNYQAEDIADEIALSYRGIYTQEKHASFETDAFSMYGNEAIPGLQLVRNRLGLSKIARKLSPQEAYLLKDRHITDGTHSSNLTKLSSIINLVDQHKRYYGGLKRLDSAGY